MTLQSNERAQWQAAQRKWQQDEAQYKASLQSEKSKMDTLSSSMIERTKANQQLQTERQHLQQITHQVPDLQEKLQA